MHNYNLMVEQEQLYLDLQQLTIKQSVVNSLGMFLAVAEGFLKSKGINITSHFGYYDHFNVERDYPELIKIKLMNNYHIFIAQKQNYLNLFNRFDFYPDNLPVREIKKIVNDWIPFAEHIGESELYKNILLLFCEDECKVYQSYYDKVKKTPKTGKNTFTHPIDQAKSLALIYQHKDEEMKNNEEKWKTQIKPTIDIVLNGKPGTSYLSKKLNSVNKLTEKETIEKMNKEIEIENMINSLLYKANRLKSTDRKDEKNNLREEIKKETKELEKTVDNYLSKYKTLDGIWTIIKCGQFQKQLQDYISSFKKEENKKLMKDIYFIFFEEDEVMN